MCANLSNENGDLLCACCSGNRKCSLNARVHVCELFWGEEPLSENLDAFSQGFHLIVASDVVYWVAEDIFAEDTLQVVGLTSLFLCFIYYLYSLMIFFFVFCFCFD